MAAISFFGDLLQTISDRGRDLVGLGGGISRRGPGRSTSPACAMT